MRNQPFFNLTFVLLSEKSVLRGCYLFSRNLSSLNGNSRVAVCNGLNALGNYCVSSAVNSYNLFCSYYSVSVNSLGCLVAVASNHCYAEQNSKR